jgi:hypothetical protein
VQSKRHRHPDSPTGWRGGLGKNNEPVGPAKFDGAKDFSHIAYLTLETRVPCNDAAKVMALETVMFCRERLHG